MMMMMMMMTTKMTICLCRSWRTDQRWNWIWSVQISVLYTAHHWRHLLAWLRSFQVFTHYQL